VQLEPQTLELDPGDCACACALVRFLVVAAPLAGCLQFVKEGVPVAKMVVVMLIYCAMTPLGILLGMTACLLGGPAGALVTTTTQAFGAGTPLGVYQHCAVFPAHALSFPMVSLECV